MKYTFYLARLGQVLTILLFIMTIINVTYPRLFEFSKLVRLAFLLGCISGPVGMCFYLLGDYKSNARNVVYNDVIINWRVISSFGIFCTILFSIVFIFIDGNSKYEVKALESMVIFFGAAAQWFCLYIWTNQMKVAGRLLH
jgi:hypothetical protein